MINFKKSFIFLCVIKLCCLKALNISTNLRFCTGQECTELWEKKVRIRTMETPANGDYPAQAMHTYVELNRESRNALLKLVNRDQVIMDIIRLE